MSVFPTLDRLAAAWNAGDAPAYAAEFTEDATYVVFNGQLLTGRREIEDVHRFLFDGPLRSSRMEAMGHDTPVRLLRPDVAHVVSGGAVVPEGQTEVTPDRLSRVSFVLVRDDGTWRVAAFQNTRQT